MKHIYKLFLSLLVISAIISCSKDDDSPETTPIVGGEISAMEVITIPLTGTNLTQNEYAGSLRGENVTLLRSAEYELTLAIPSGISEGPAELLIPALGITIQYNITHPVLTDTPDNVLAGLFSQLDNYTQAIGTAPIPELETSVQLVAAFESIYNDASADEKEAIAKFYQVNRLKIDEVLIASIAAESGRFDIIAAAEVAHGVFVKAAQGMVLGAGIIMAADYVATNPSVFAAAKIIGALVTGVALGLVVTKLKEFTAAHTVADMMSIAGIQGILDRNTNDVAINLSNEVASTVSISTFRRPVNTSDTTSTNSMLKKFFTGYETYSSVISKINAAITYVNSKVPFTIPQVTLRTIAEETSADEEIVNEEIFNQIQLSVAHPNLQLVSSQWSADGQLTLKVKIVGTPATLPIESSLHFSYTDSFSDFSGTIPLVVNSENPLVGTWTMVSFKNGTPVGDFIYTYYPNCPQLWAYKESETGTFTFTESDFSFVWNNLIVHPNINFNPDTCELYGDNPDTTTEDVETGSGTYSFNGTSYTLTYTWGEQDVIQWITDDRIKIFDQEFVRN